MTASLLPHRHTRLRPGASWPEGRATGLSRRRQTRRTSPRRRRFGSDPFTVAFVDEHTRTAVVPVDATRHLDPRVWLVWLAAVIGPALIARNPFPLMALFIVVLVVRAAWTPALARDGGWSFVLRFAIVAALVSIAFNGLTAPFGDQILVRLPSWWPFGDVLTANALLFGVLSAVAIVIIVLAGLTVGRFADWPELLRSVPPRLLPLAVAGSIAWSFIPRTVATVRDIRDAQRVRGLRMSPARTLLPLVVPLLATSLERATTMAEALEARGFGGPLGRPTTNHWRRRVGALAMTIGLALAVAAIYLFLDGSSRPASVSAVVAVTLLLPALSGHTGGDYRSRYRVRVWRRRDTAVLLTSILSLGITSLTLAWVPDALRYSPYPDIPVPTVSIPFVLSLGLLLTPAVVAPLVASGRSMTREALGSGGSRGPETITRRSSYRQVEIGQRRRWPPLDRRPWASWPPRSRGQGRPGGRVPIRKTLMPLAGARRG